MGIDWPEGIIERPILTNIKGKTVTFKDGKQKHYDVIIKCTGYIHSFPFMSQGISKTVDAFSTVVRVKIEN